MTLALAAALALGVLAAGGCEQGEWGGMAAGGAGAGRLRVGIGWSSAGAASEAGRQAAQAALKGVGRSTPDLVLVWDNWPNRDDGRAVIAAVARQAPDRIIYGGQVAWPAWTEWTTSPTVLVCALAGGWGVRTAVVHDVVGRERQAGRLLADGLGLPGASAPAFAPAATQPFGAAGRETADRPSGVGRPAFVPAKPGGPSGGELVLLFGDVGGERAGRLVGGLTERAGVRLPAVGGAGAGQGGSGRQYVAGRMWVDSVWAVRLSGPIRVRAIRLPLASDAKGLPAAPSRLEIEQACSLATTLLAEDLPDPPAAWRLALLMPSAGWLPYLAEPGRTVAAVAERLGQPSGRGTPAVPGGGPGQRATAMVAGWAADSQIGPQGEDATLGSGQFGLSMAVIEPLSPAGESR